MTTTVTRTAKAAVPRLAVTFIHGAETSDPGYADRAVELLRRSFAKHSGADPDEALVVRPVYWAPVLQAAEDDLLQRCFGAGNARYVRWLRRQAARADHGSRLALLALSSSTLLPRVPFAGPLPFPTLRWATTEFTGDALAYQVAGDRDHAVYDSIHARVAEALRELSIEAGPGAPLCVLAHSLGSVIASNYFYDLQVEYGRYPRGGPLALGRGHATAGRVPAQSRGVTSERPTPRRLVPAATRLALGPSPSPLERGETLTDLITMGSPLALWSLRSRGFHRPLLVPSPGPGGTGPATAVQPAGGGRPTGGWINIYSPYDLVSQPLRPLSEEYRLAVHEDIRMGVGPWWASRGPLSHVWYWNDARVAELTGRALARTWRELAGVSEGAALARRATGRRPARRANATPARASVARPSDARPARRLSSVASAVPAGVTIARAVSPAPRASENGMAMTAGGARTPPARTASARTVAPRTAAATKSAAATKPGAKSAGARGAAAKTTAAKGTAAGSGAAKSTRAKAAAAPSPAATGSAASARAARPAGARTAATARTTATARTGTAARPGTGKGGAASR